MMTEQEYQFMSGKWEGPRGAAYNAVYGFCRSFRWILGLDREGVPILTQKGMEALKEYEKKFLNS